jgi:transcriptional regulator with XRE-family HTH domain
LQQAHRRVAFPLPGVPLNLRWDRPKPYQQHPNTLGEHLRKRRLERGRTQRQVSVELLVTQDTFLLWEQDRAKPSARYYPAIFGFLGYDPLPAPIDLAGRIGRKRLELGLSIKNAAKLIGVDEGTFGRWERGEWVPRMSGPAVEMFLGMRVRRADELG